MRGKTRTSGYTESQREFTFYKEYSKLMTSDTFDYFKKDLIRLATSTLKQEVEISSRVYRNGKFRVTFKFKKPQYEPDCLVVILESIVNASILVASAMKEQEALRKKQETIENYVLKVSEYYTIYEKGNIKAIKYLMKNIC